jgi:hypothetical protein
MPKTTAETQDRPYGFKFHEAGAALVHLLRAMPPGEFHKFCPDMEQHATCTQPDDMMLAMFGALRGVLRKIGDLPEEGSNATKLCAAYEIAPKVGRPRREVVINEEAEKRADAIIEERRRLQINARARQRSVSTPVGVDVKAHVGGFTTRGTRVEPAKAAAIVEVCKAVCGACWRVRVAQECHDRFPMFRAGIAVLELGGVDVRVHVRLSPQVSLEGVKAGDSRYACILSLSALILPCLIAYWPKVPYG